MPCIYIFLCKFCKFFVHFVNYGLNLISSKFIEMDNLAEFYISDEEEPLPKTRKIRKPVAKAKQIKISNFSQVKNNNIFDPEYKNWINKFNSKIFNYFTKVHSTKLSKIILNYLVYNFLRFRTKIFRKKK